MPMMICSGAQLRCSYGSSPSALNVLPVNRVMLGTPAATILDFAPGMNVPPFGQCSASANPAVIAAKSPMPCVPLLIKPWTVAAPTPLVGQTPSLDSTATLNCMWGGVVTIDVPGQFTTQVP